MHQPEKRNYNILAVLILGFIGTLCYGLTFSGQAAFLVGLIPGERLGEHFKKQIVTLTLREDVTQITVPKARTYRIITQGEDLYARNLEIYAKESGEKLVPTVLNIIELGEYDSEIVNGRPVIDVRFPKSGNYELHVVNYDEDDPRPVILMFPNNTARNRTIAYSLIALFLLGIIYWVWSMHVPSIPKAQRQQNKSKWDEFSDSA